MINANSSLENFQELNRKIYTVTNDRSYSIERMCGHIHRHITQVLKAVRKEKHDNTMYHLCMAFSWAMAILNRFHVELANDMWHRFPGLCPYCLCAPCSCKERPLERHRLEGKSKGEKPISLRDWQLMFAKIYPNSVIESAIHLAEEAGEVDEALQNYSTTHKNDWFWKAVEELVDAITNIFGVANCLNLDLADGLAGFFANGCPKCCHSPCDCDYVTVDQPLPLRKRVD
ncbi:MAG: hypothetical protein AAB352_01035 [Patescibacteria group bacterium]